MSLLLLFSENWKSQWSNASLRFRSPVIRVPLWIHAPAVHPSAFGDAACAGAFFTKPPPFAPSPASAGHICSARRQRMRLRPKARALFKIAGTAGPCHLHDWFGCVRFSPTSIKEEVAISSFFMLRLPDLTSVVFCKADVSFSLPI